MNFIEAVKLAKQGKIMGYKVIEDDYINYLSTHDDHSHTNDHLVNADTDALYKIYLDDILRDDWEEVEAIIKTYSFKEAFKKGSLIKRLNWNDYKKISDSDDYELLFSIDDIETKDWIIKEEV